jgi:hypothetical protein
VKGWFRRVVGISAMDFLIQAVLTICAIGIFVDDPGVRDEVVVFGVVGLSVLVLAIRRHFAIRRGDGGETTGELTARQMAELEIRVSELEAAQLRVAELEDRLDFAERLLTQRQEQILPGAPGSP